MTANSKEFHRQDWYDANMNIDADCLCNDCPILNSCEYAWDLYNVGTGCLGNR